MATSLSSRRATFELSVSLILITGLIYLAVLFVIDQLPSIALKIVSLLIATITLLASLTNKKLDDVIPFFSKRWANSNRRVVTATALLTILIIFLSNVFLPKIFLDPYISRDRLNLNDTLINFTSADNLHSWEDDSSKPNRLSLCLFTSEGYQVSDSMKGDITYCRASDTEYQNFVYEVQMRFVRGDFGGITFTDENQDNCYYFGVHSNGRFEFMIYKGCPSHPTSVSTIPLSTDEVAPSFKQGNQLNRIAVVVYTDKIGLYINNQFLNNEFLPGFTFQGGQYRYFCSGPR